jgi:hypothetical protein
VEVRIVGDRFRNFRHDAWPFPVTIQTHVTHSELGNVFGSSSAFFLCLNSPAARQLPAKLYEYLRTGRPTFAIAPKGGIVESWLASTGAGISVPVEQPELWTPALLQFISTLDRYQPPAGEQYERRLLTRSLAMILDEIALERSSSSEGTSRTF